MLLPAGANVVPRITLGVRHARVGLQAFMRQDIALYSGEGYRRGLHVEPRGPF